MSKNNKKSTVEAVKPKRIKAAKEPKTLESASAALIRNGFPVFPVEKRILTGNKVAGLRTLSNIDYLTLIHKYVLLDKDASRIFLKEKAKREGKR